MKEKHWQKNKTNKKQHKILTCVYRYKKDFFFGKETNMGEQDILLVTLIHLFTGSIDWVQTQAGTV